MRRIHTRGTTTRTGIEGGDDPAFLTKALGEIARIRGMKLSRDTGISREGLCKALSGEGNPGSSPRS